MSHLGSRGHIPLRQLGLSGDGAEEDDAAQCEWDEAALIHGSFFAVAGIDTATYLWSIRPVNNEQSQGDEDDAGGCCVETGDHCGLVMVHV